MAGMTQKPVSAVSKKRGPARSERRKAIDAAGISRGQAWRAEMVANIPADIFERLIEGDNPPTVSRLVEIGRQFAGLPPSTPPARRLKCCPHCGGDLTGTE